MTSSDPMVLFATRTAAVLGARLVPAQAMVLLHLLTYPGVPTGAECWPAIETLAHASGLGVNAARRRLHELAEIGLLEIRERSWAPHCYRVCWSHPRFSEPSHFGSPVLEEDSQNEGADPSRPPETGGLTPPSPPETGDLSPESEASRNGSQITPLSTISSSATPTTSDATARSKTHARGGAPLVTVAGEEVGTSPCLSLVDNPGENPVFSVVQVFPEAIGRALHVHGFQTLQQLSQRSRSAVAAAMGKWATRGRLDLIRDVLADHGLSFRDDGFTGPAARDGPASGKVLSYRQKRQEDWTDEEWKAAARGMTVEEWRETQKQKDGGGR